MISSISWTFLNDAMAISAKEFLKNHTDKERFEATSSYILTVLFPRKRRRSSPSSFWAAEFWSRILKSLIQKQKPAQRRMTY